VFATPTGFVQLARAAVSATVHSGDVVHGVTSLTRGTCYSPFFCQTQCATGGGVTVEEYDDDDEHEVARLQAR
jgi:hypothetical protein